MASGAQFYIGGMTMNAVGIEVSEGMNIVAIIRPFGEVVFSPFEMSHTAWI